MSSTVNRSVLPIDVDPVAVEIVRLRAAGESYTSIAALTGTATTFVKKVLRRAAELVLEDKHEFVLKQLADCEFLRQKIMAKYEGGLPIDSKDVMAFVKVQEREASLLGLNQPTSVKLAVALQDKSDEELAALAAANGIETILASDFDLSTTEDS
jgi:hypothetical protein